MKPLLIALCALATGGTFLEPARAGDLQTMMRKAGEWEMTMVGGPFPAAPRRACYRGDKTVADLATSGLKDCSQQNLSISGGLATVDAVCSIERMRVTIHATARPTGDAAFHADGHVHLDGLQGVPGLRLDMPVAIDAHRLGPCRPGDDPM